MASVTSLDKDLRKLRLDKYTPAAVNEARTWIEHALGENLASADLLDALKDGVALCRLINLVIPPPGIKYKRSSMPFVQMENISHFLNACQAPPLSLQQHDIFLTVDLYEQKDPAQVLQCLGAFSRAANALDPSQFPTAIGPKTRPGGGMSPQTTASSSPTRLRGRGASSASNASSAYSNSKPVLANRTGDSTASGRPSPTRGLPPLTSSNGTSAGPVTSWSLKEHEGATAPAWNIAQYGYMGGASQGNLGISFGGRRQITSAGPYIPNLAEKERRRKEEEERQRQAAEEEERRRRAEVEAEEERARKEEEIRWEQETRRRREEERRRADDERRRWEEEERQWMLTEQRRRQEEEEAEARLEAERSRARSRSATRRRLPPAGQAKSVEQVRADEGSQLERIRELEQELELARQREAEYERERQQRRARSGSRPPDELPKPRARSRSRPPAGMVTPPAQGPDRPPARFESWSRDKPEVLDTQWKPSSEGPEPEGSLAMPSAATSSSRPLPVPGAAARPETSPGDGLAGRPLPDPSQYAAASTSSSTSPATPVRSERQAMRDTPPRPPPRGPDARGPASSPSKTPRSLLEREMEMERQRQREWEEAQMERAADDRSHPWSVHPAADGANRPAPAMAAARRQMVGPRPLPGGAAPR